MRSIRRSICEIRSQILSTRKSRSAIFITSVTVDDGCIVANANAFSVLDLGAPLCASADELSDVCPDDAQLADVHFFDVVTDLLDEKFLLHHVCVLLAVCRWGVLTPAMYTHGAGRDNDEAISKAYFLIPKYSE